MRIAVEKIRMRREKRRLETEIRENSRQYELTLNEENRRNLIYLHRQYELKFGKCYKG